MPESNAQPPAAPSPPASCCFCGVSFTVSKRTAEHIIPQWLLKAAGVTKSDRHEFGRGADDGSEQKRMTGAYSHIYRRICSQCNSGWLSELEQEAKRIVNRMVGYEDFVIAWPDNLFLSAWAYKIFALTHLSEGSPKAALIRPRDLRVLQEKLLTEGDCYLAVCRCTEPRKARINLHLFRHSFLTSAEEAIEKNPAKSKCFVGMLRAADLLFLFAYVPPGGEWALELDSQLKGCLQIWPPIQETRFIRSALPDVLLPERMEFLFFHPLNAIEQR